MLPVGKLFDAIKANNIDAAIAAIAITNARKSDFSITMPYLNSSGSYLVKTNEMLSADLDKSSTKIIGVEKGTIFEDYLEILYGKDSVKIKRFDNDDDLLDALVKQKVDVLIMDTPVAEFWLRNYKLNFKLAPIPLSNVPIAGEGYGIVLNKNNTQLLNSLNKAISAMRADGSLKLLIDKYFLFSSIYPYPRSNPPLTILDTIIPVC